MAMQIGVGKWSAAFIALMSNESKTLSIQEYDSCLSEWKAAHEKRTITNYLLAIVFFCAGLWAVWENTPVMAVLLLALAANFNRQSSHHVLFAEVMGSQRLLAMLINKQSQEIAALRTHATESDEAPPRDHGA